MNDVDIFPNMTLQQYWAYLHADAHQQKIEVDNKINDLMSLVKTANDALMIMPLVKGLMDTRNNTCDIQGRLVNTITKVSCAVEEAQEQLGLTEQEKADLLKEIEAEGVRKYKEDVGASRNGKK